MYPTTHLVGPILAERLRESATASTARAAAAAPGDRGRLPARLPDRRSVATVMQRLAEAWNQRVRSPS